MFAAGISAGFFIFEKTRLAGGALLMISAAVIVCSAAARSGLSLAVNGNDKSGRRLIAALMLGFAVFTCRFAWYGTGIISGPNYTDGISETEKSEEPDESPDTRRIEGMVRSVSVKDGRIRLVICDTDAVRKGMRVLVSTKADTDADECGTETEMLIGRRITAYGKLNEPQGADNPGCFDYRIYLRSRGIGYTFAANYIELSDRYRDSSHPGTAAGFITGAYGAYLRGLYRARETFLDLFSDDDIRAFIKGTVFGDKADISEDVMNDFNSNGTGHILAVSGLHTGFLYALMRLFTRRRRNLRSAVLTIGVLFLYGDMTMWSPSTMRAVTVLTVSIMAVFARRPFDLLSAVSAAAVLILIREPYQLFSAGFQMSFLALLGIAFLADPLSHFTGEAMAVMLSVQAGIMPVTAYYFHRINVLSVFINIPVIFLASILVPLCMCTLFASSAAGIISGILSAGNGIPSGGASSLAGWLTHIVIMTAEGLTNIVIRLNGIMSADGSFSDRVTSPAAGAVIFFYLMIFMISSEWCRIRLLRRENRMIVHAVICILAVSACAGLASYNRFADDEVVFVSVGQGDCTHIRAGGKDVLIDGGGSTDHNTGRDVLEPYLLANGAERAEITLVTHLHTDHYLGIAELAEVYPVGAVGIPSDYRESLERMKGGGLPDTETALSLSGLPERIVYIEPGSVINITDDVYVKAIWPPEGQSSSIDIDDPNEHNTVYMVWYGNVKIMVTGDLLEEDEIRMEEYYRGTDMMKCDILKVAHHGSKSSSCDDFLDAASPEIAVIQVGRNNWYGHPHQQTLDRLEERGIQIYRTDLNGAVGIDIRSGRRSRRIVVDRYK